jgi:hypothetical protein
MASPCSGRLVLKRSVALDKDGRGSTGPAVGPRRRKDMRNYPRPQVEAKDNVNHRAHQRGARHEETTCRTHNCADTKKGAPSPNGAAPGASIRGH